MALVRKNDAARFLRRKILFADQEELEERTSKVIRKGENYTPKDIVPERKLFERDLDDMLDACKGAVKARLQLGFDSLGTETINLKPIIKELEDKLKATAAKPLMTSATTATVVPGSIQNKAHELPKSFSVG